MKNLKIHFIAIGGSAMHNLAIALKKKGMKVTGSDDEIFEPSKSRLQRYGLLPLEEGWHPESVNTSIDVIILGMHARKDNPELLKAQKLGLKIYSYPEFLFQHAQNKKRVVIGGSHGKTTITAMVMHVLKKQDKSFDYLVGSQLKDFEVMTRLSNEAPVMVFEGDEYLSSPLDPRPKFHWYRPHVALLSGIAWDHMNVFPDFERYLDQFALFIELMEEGGTLIYNETDEHLRKLVSKTKKDLHFIPYNQLEYEILNGITHVFYKNKKFPLKVFGRHNLQNLNGARLICNQMGIDDLSFFEAIQSFSGTANRLELISANGNSRLFKDFAHAPSKLRATLDAVREQFPEQKLVACFELHTFSSLNAAFLEQYEDTMNSADEALVYFNPHALEMKRLPMLDERQITDAFNRNDLKVFRDADKMVDELKKFSGVNTVYLMMSSGNFDGIQMNELAAQLL
ncbi:MAG: peptidoglycan synthetase [Bacteroidales bacterium]|nr:peptidoglycan synthetase [Bacteroidales bacterium]